MAVARMDGSVEVFHCSDRFFQEKIIPGREQCGIEGLSWVGERLFSAGLNGGITEYDLTNQKAKYTIDAYGGPIWAIAGNQQGTHLAVGCEDGTVKLFEVNEDSIQFERNLDRQKSRIVSLSWHPSGSKIAAGMMDMIQVFNIETGHSLHRMLADRGVGTSRSKECVVWSVVYLSDGTIITGDSVGMVKLWDDQTGTLIKSHNVTKCDVLALSVSQNEDSLVAGTSEGIVVQFQFVSMVLEKDDKEWVRTRTFRNHTHDIRAVAEITTAVVSGGELLKEHSQVSGLGLMLFQYPGHLELWRLGESEGKGIPGSSLFVKRNPEKLLHLKVKGEDHIRCSAVSPCGEWIVYSTASTLRLYRLHCDNNNISITKISKLPKVLSSASQLCFSSDSSHLFSASAQSSVHLVSISQSGCKFVGTLKPKSDSHQAIHLLAASEDGKWVASANSDHEVHIYNLQTRKAHCTVPVYSSAVTAMGIHPATNCVFMMHADQQMFEYSIEQKQYTDWSRTVQRKGLHRLWVERDTPCLNVMFSPQNPSHVILHDMYMLCIIDQSLVRQTRIQKAFSLIFLILVDLCIYIYIYIYIYICLLFQLPAPIKQKKFAT
uniref:U3 small nucleolar RNA-associated protein 4 homolog n=1 Tax=Sinocyclocheilus grahami TaxID=75366 RepID=A0A672R687_SINGR